MKKLKTLLILACSNAFLLSTHAQELDWANNFVPTSDLRVGATTVDAAGNVYSVGYYGGTTDFDPGTGTYNLTAVGYYDIFITKLDASGNFVWAKTIGSTGNNDYANSITIDASGNIYITGGFPFTADFDPGVGVFNLTSTGGWDIFILKLDAAGNFVWAKSMGSSAHHDYGDDITVDASGNVFTTGTFWNTVDFNPGAGVFNLTSAGDVDDFILELDAAGNFVMAKRMGGSGSDVGTSIELDAAGNIYTSGYFELTADFDPGAGTSNLTSAGQYDIFYSKLNASGNFVWAKRIGGTGHEEANQMVMDASGNLYTTGCFDVTVDFDPNAGTANLTAAGGDIYVNKMDTAGNYVWAKSMGSINSNERGYGVDVDASGNVYSTGGFWGTADFDPGPGISNLVSGGYGDMFINKLDASGNYVWAYSFGSTSMVIDWGQTINIGPSGSIYITGVFQNTVDFDPGPGTANLTAPVGYTTVFTQKLNQCASVMSTENVTACPPFTWRDGITYTTSQTGINYTVNGAVNGGCDSTYVLNLNIATNTVSLSSSAQSDISCFGSSDGAAAVNVATGGSGNYTYNWMPGNPNGDGTTSVTGLPAGTWTCTATDDNGCAATQPFTITEPAAITGSFTHTTCDSYTWNTQAYTASGTYTQTLTAANGCDSTVTLNLTINHSTSRTDVIAACDSYTWIDGITYTSSNNTATHILPNSAGCDSIITLNLTINTTPAVTVSDNGSGTLTATAAASYQWINCSTNLPIAGETSSTFSPVVNGTYAVIAYSAALCADTSSCMLINYLGMTEVDNVVWSIMPNPAGNQVIVTFNANAAELTIREAQGKSVVTTTIHSGETVSLEGLSAGVYFVELVTAEGKTVKRLLKM